MATDLEAVNDRIIAIEKTITAVVAEHELGEIVTSLPGIGTTVPDLWGGRASGRLRLRVAIHRAAGRHAGLSRLPAAAI
ncbi:hypothetical protein [Verrucosispora sp. NA02020]|uniref:hypothetical protein n=1 Tax=Verrucosispora sp. NA02020 TaxID=2742132 RepID=UPI0020CA6C26|nr:hypothetical protein [Verrucosispora sp. NA02020]